MAQVVRVFILTPPVGTAHPKTEVLKLAAKRGIIALRVRKVKLSGEMRVIARGPSEELAGFRGDLHHKQKDEGWWCTDQETTPGDESELTGGGRGILRSDDAVAGGADSSGRERELPVANDNISSVDSGSTASARLIKSEVQRERERNEALLAVALEEAAAAAAAHEAAALEEAAAAAAAREAAVLEEVAAREAAVFESTIVAFMKLANITRTAAEEALRGAK